MSHREIAKRVFLIESKAIEKLVDSLDEQFTKSVETILSSRGRVIICGMGKSGIIGKKISATLASTGTPSFSMHPGEAFHGDLGMVVSEDIFLAISNSGETEELLKLLPFLKDNGNTLISMTGNRSSTLAQESMLHLDISVEQEACPLKLAPTSSTTATLAMGDALAVALMEARNFQPENFARFHPGGSLGRKLLTRVSHEMVKDNLPVVHSNSSFSELLHSVTSGEQGLAVVMDESGNIQGLVTDGDIRRAMENHRNEVFSLTASQFMTPEPLVIEPDELVSVGVELMEKKKVTKLLVARNNRLLGILRK